MLGKGASEAIEDFNGTALVEEAFGYWDFLARRSYHDSSGIMHASQRRRSAVWLGFLFDAEEMEVCTISNMLHEATIIDIAAPWASF